MARRRPRVGLWIVLGGLVVAVIAAIFAVRFIQRDEPERFANILDHFKYGSYGSEGRGGVPYSLWLALPRAFPEHLPKGPGSGYERLGFLYEPGRRDRRGARRPIGTSYREDPIGQIGLNCAVCHTATLRESPDAPRRIIPAMPANQFNLQEYVGFLRRVAKDRRFNAKTLIPVMREVDPKFSRTDELLYRHVLIDVTKRSLQRLDDDFAWMDRRPAEGPGRVDTFNPYKVLLDRDARRGIYLGPRDREVGTVDLPSIWNQRPREGMYLHWDGNNNSVQERNISAAIGSGVDENPSEQTDSLDEEALFRVGDWIADLKPPRYPAERIDGARARCGATIYRE